MIIKKQLIIIVTKMNLSKSKRSNTLIIILLYQILLKVNETEAGRCDKTSKIVG